MRYIAEGLVLVVLGAACGSPAPEVRELRAFGNEPFWNVTISAAEGITYGRLGEENIVFPYAVPRASSNGVELTFGPLKADSAVHEIEIRIQEEDCQDTMADIIHPMRATVILDGEALSGCARDLNADTPVERP